MDSYVLHPLALLICVLLKVPLIEKQQKGVTVEFGEEVSTESEDEEMERMRAILAQYQ
jgi:hypothetical protein